MLRPDEGVADLVRELADAAALALVLADAGEVLRGWAPDPVAAIDTLLEGPALDGVGVRAGCARNGIIA